MMTLVRSWSLRFVAASLVLATIPAFAEDAEGVVRLGQSEAAGVIRISDLQQPQLTYRGQSEEVQSEEVQQVGAACRTCPSGVVYDGQVCESCPGPYLCSDSPVVQYITFNLHLLALRNQQAMSVFRASFREDLREKARFTRCKLGYFCPDGGIDGKGVPPWGRYRMVYPVNPSYFDQRDGQVYAASGYGGPVSVPLAPNVNHTYNYGWGIPSSRLTPIAHPLTPGVPTP